MTHYSRLGSSDFIMEPDNFLAAGAAAPRAASLKTSDPSYKTVSNVLWPNLICRHCRIAAGTPTHIAQVDKRTLHNTEWCEAPRIYLKMLHSKLCQNVPPDVHGP